MTKTLGFDLHFSIEGKDYASSAYRHETETSHEKCIDYRIYNHDQEIIEKFGQGHAFMYTKNEGLIELSNTPLNFRNLLIQGIKNAFPIEG